MQITPDARLAALGEEYFRAHNEANPFEATVFGVPGYDAAVPDPSRAADEEIRSRLAVIDTELTTIDVTALSDDDWGSHSWLSTVVANEHDALRDGIGEVSASTNVVPLLVGTVPTVSVDAPEAATAYLARLGKIAGYLDALAQRQLAAQADGRTPVASGLRRCIREMDAYLAAEVKNDPLLGPRPAADADPDRWLARVETLVRDEVRPALARYRAVLADRLLPTARDDGNAGVMHVPGGADAYLNLVRARTTTPLTPDEIHAMGLRLVTQLREEFADRGGATLGVRDPDEVIRRLREDPGLRFGTSGEIVDAVTAALHRAEEALPGWFHRYDMAPCVVREMDPAEAENSVLGYYQPPAGDGSRPGAHVINTLHAAERMRFEYEALAFHESVPGHHLQIAVAQAQTALPEYRRYAYLDAHGEGWGLYAERLADEMGLYSGDVARLGMVSFDAWRACRLVVDTGIHAFGWSRQRAVDYMRDNTALSMRNIANEVDRYIATPAQALAYMVGRQKIVELRERMRTRAGAAFDVRDFHHLVLAHGALPLSTLERMAARTA